MKKKTCNVCEETKPLELFVKHSGINKSSGLPAYPDGRGKTCKACATKASQARRAKSLDKNNMKRREVYRANAEELAAKARESYAANAEQKRAQRKANREADPEKYRAYTRKSMAASRGNDPDATSPLSRLLIQSAERKLKKAQEQLAKAKKLSKQKP